MTRKRASRPTEPIAFDYAAEVEKRRRAAQLVEPAERPAYHWPEVDAAGTPRVG